MSTFIRLLGEKRKSEGLLRAVVSFRRNSGNRQIFSVDTREFKVIEGMPFSYWIGGSFKKAFQRLARFESGERASRVGLQTSDDFRFVRTWWEVPCGSPTWFNFAKGGRHSPFYAEISLVVNWGYGGREIKAWADPLYGNSGWSRIIKSTEYYLRPALVWPLRARKFAPHMMPRGCIFSNRSYSAFTAEGDELATLALFNSAPFDYIFKCALGRFGYPEFLVGILQDLPWAQPDAASALELTMLAGMAWRLTRDLDTTEETSHAFLLPRALRGRLGAFDATKNEKELLEIQEQIDCIAARVFGVDAGEMHSVSGDEEAAALLEAGNDGEEHELDANGSSSVTDELISWCVGVAFGRFDWRLATGERAEPSNPQPTEPLPIKSPGMLPDGADGPHNENGILVDDQGHQHDIARAVEELLLRLKEAIPDDVRGRIQRDFFALHLQRYSKSRRKSPIYLPLATVSGSYTLWIYYPSLGSQTLYIAINDYVEPKLKQVDADVTALRNKGSARNRDDEKRFEALQAFELELVELRDTLLKLAPAYKPDHDDGVQISAAPLWPLFRHKPWQKVLKDTWATLERGDYDWAHLAMNYWPERVREKCKTDKSLAIAHGLEDLYIEPEAKPKKALGKKKAGGDE